MKATKLLQVHRPPRGKRSAWNGKQLSPFTSKRFFSCCLKSFEMAYHMLEMMMNMLFSDNGC
ncbi:hypothetical protein SD77_1767 [Bacillus badius]|uniref:Ribose 5-phosphate isomerase B n=1 Tax=Bacillus badius TaxID=1455 RepID=A0ABR5AQY3_BACBA|nr:hypothetical protein SD77_1767 [Bacillus badius]